jgi:hypothetical protein
VKLGPAHQSGDGRARRSSLRGGPLHSVIGVSTSFGNTITSRGFLYEAARPIGNLWRLSLGASAAPREGQ